jgi:hypothetical protein
MGITSPASHYETAWHMRMRAHHGGIFDAINTCMSISTHTHLSGYCVKKKQKNMHVMMLRGIFFSPLEGVRGSSVTEMH